MLYPGRAIDSLAVTDYARERGGDVLALTPPMAPVVILNFKNGANLDANLGLAESLRKIADEIGASPAQIAIAWVAAQGRDIVPLVGARRRDRLTEALGALDVKLTQAHQAALDEAFPPGIAAGARYPEAQLAHMDSEKR